MDSIYLVICILLNGFVIQILFHMLLLTALNITAYRTGCFFLSLIISLLYSVFFPSEILSGIMLFNIALPVFSSRNTTFLSHTPVNTPLYSAFLKPALPQTSIPVPVIPALMPPTFYAHLQRRYPQACRTALLALEFPSHQPQQKFPAPFPCFINPALFCRCLFFLIRKRIYRPHKFFC